MDDLLARLEAATEGSRELDGYIWIAILPRDGAVSPVPDGPHIPALARGYAWSYSAHDGRVEMYPEKDGKRAICVASRYAPRYTTSIDDALTLVPKGWGYKIDSGLGHGHTATVGHVGTNKLYDQPEGWGGGQTPALAVCIAALNARAAGKGAE